MEMKGEKLLKDLDKFVDWRFEGYGERYVNLMQYIKELEENFECSLKEIEYWRNKYGMMQEKCEDLEDEFIWGNEDE